MTKDGGMKIPCCPSMRFISNEKILMNLQKCFIKVVNFMLIYFSKKTL